MKMALVIGMIHNREVYSSESKQTLHFACAGNKHVHVAFVIIEFSVLYLNVLLSGAKRSASTGIEERYNN